MEEVKMFLIKDSFDESEIQILIKLINEDTIFGGSQHRPDA